MRSEIRRIRRPLAKSELASMFTQKETLGGEDLDRIIQKIPLEHVSVEERRKEAKKPLYLVRYE